VLTGAPGAGKTTTLDALATLLDVEEIEYCAFECEQLAWGKPRLPFAEAVRHLDAVLALQRAAGRRLFLLAAGVESSDELRRIVDAARADRTLVVCVAARPEVVARRLDVREPDRWPDKRDLIARARRLAEAVTEIEGIDVVLDTERGSPEAVAARILEAMRSHGLPCSRGGH
jgi:broad-specificity NMP kinase